jgi:hypothetical protein
VSEPDPAAAEPAPDPEPAMAVSDPDPDPDPAAFDPGFADPEPGVVAVPEPSPPSFFLPPQPSTRAAEIASNVKPFMPGMLHASTVRALALTILLGVAAIARAEPYDVRMPPGTRTDSTGQLVSGRGLRDTTDFIAKELARRGILVNQIGPYRVRGVELTRFVATAASTPWLAIHVMRTGGKTLIFFVPRPKA